MSAACPPPGRRRRLPALVALLGVVLGGAWFGWRCQEDPEVALLVDRRGARWIVDPAPPRAGTRPATPLTTRFERSVSLERVPAAAPLELRAFRTATASINGTVIDLPEVEDWKDRCRVDVAGHLRAGENRITVDVRNDRGPPALWLRLRAGTRLLVTDGTWLSSIEGAPPAPARPAAQRLPVVAIDPAVAELDPAPGLARRWVWLVAYAFLAAIAWTAWRRYRAVLAPWVPWAVFGVVALSWVVLFLGNAPSLWARDGYDAEAHLQYIDYLRDHGRLPPVDHGWSTFQPPLYYVGSALLLGLAGVETSAPWGGFVLQLQGLIFGLAQLAFITAGLREVFPRRPGAQVLGLIVAGSLPVHLYMHQFVANDGLAAALAAASLWLALRIARRGSGGSGAWLALGGCLGAALLAKASTLIVAVATLGVAFIALALERAPWRDWLRGPLAALGALVLVAGPHYGRVWARYGTPLVGNWDPRVVDGWWQDPGYLTPAFYGRMLDAFRLPTLSSLNGLPQGLYTTLWGDGLIAGRTELLFAPPWNADALAAGYLLALVPSILGMIGLARMLHRSYRRPDAVTWLLMAVAAATLVALVAWPLGLPIYSVIKAAFATPASLVLAVAVAHGVGWLAARRRGLGVAACVALGTWALNAHATFRIPPGSPRAQARLGLLYAALSDETDAARRSLTLALERAPHEPAALLGAAMLARRAGDPVEAEQRLAELLRHHPGHARGRLALARLLRDEGRPVEAIEHYREALRARPGLSSADRELGELLLEQGRPVEAAAELRRALRVRPEEAPAIRTLLRRAEREATP